MLGILNSNKVIRTHLDELIDISGEKKYILDEEEAVEQLQRRKIEAVFSHDSEAKWEALEWSHTASRPNTMEHPLETRKSWFQKQTGEANIEEIIEDLPRVIGVIESRALAEHERLYEFQTEIGTIRQKFNDRWEERKNNKSVWASYTPDDECFKIEIAVRLLTVDLERKQTLLDKMRDSASNTQKIEKAKRILSRDSELLRNKISEQTAEISNLMAKLVMLDYEHTNVQNEVAKIQHNQNRLVTRASIESVVHIQSFINSAKNSANNALSKVSKKQKAAIKKAKKVRNAANKRVEELQLAVALKQDAMNEAKEFRAKKNEDLVKASKAKERLEELKEELRQIKEKPIDDPENDSRVKEYRDEHMQKKEEIGLLMKRKRELQDRRDGLVRDYQKAVQDLEERNIPTPVSTPLPDSLQQRMSPTRTSQGFGMASQSLTGTYSDDDDEEGSDAEDYEENTLMSQTITDVDLELAILRPSNILDCQNVIMMCRDLSKHRRRSLAVIVSMAEQADPSKKACKIEEFPKMLHSLQEAIESGDQTVIPHAKDGYLTTLSSFVTSHTLNIKQAIMFTEDMLNKMPESESKDNLKLEKDAILDELTSRTNERNEHFKECQEYMVSAAQPNLDKRTQLGFVRVALDSCEQYLMDSFNFRDKLPDLVNRCDIMCKKARLYSNGSTLSGNLNSALADKLKVKTPADKKARRRNSVVEVNQLQQNNDLLRLQIQQAQNAVKSEHQNMVFSELGDNEDSQSDYDSSEEELDEKIIAEVTEADVTKLEDELNELQNEEIDLENQVMDVIGDMEVPGRAKAEIDENGLVIGPDGQPLMEGSLMREGARTPSLSELQLELPEPGAEEALRSFLEMEKRTLKIVREMIRREKWWSTRWSMKFGPLAKQRYEAKLRQAEEARQNSSRPGSNVRRYTPRLVRHQSFAVNRNILFTGMGLSKINFWPIHGMSFDDNAKQHQPSLFRHSPVFHSSGAQLPRISETPVVLSDDEWSDYDPEEILGLYEGHELDTMTEDIIMPREPQGDSFAASLLRSAKPSKTQTSFERKQKVFDSPEMPLLSTLSSPQPKEMLALRIPKVVDMQMNFGGEEEPQSLPHSPKASNWVSPSVKRPSNKNTITQNNYKKPRNISPLDTFSADSLLSKLRGHGIIRPPEEGSSTSRGFPRSSRFSDSNSKSINNGSKTARVIRVPSPRMSPINTYTPNKPAMFAPTDQDAWLIGSNTSPKQQQQPAPTNQLIFGDEEEINDHNRRIIKNKKHGDSININDKKLSLNTRSSITRRSKNVTKPFVRSKFLQQEFSSGFVHEDKSGFNNNNSFMQHEHEHEQQHNSPFGLSSALSSRLNGSVASKARPWSISESPRHQLQQPPSVWSALPSPSPNPTPSISSSPFQSVPNQNMNIIEDNVMLQSIRDMDITESHLHLNNNNNNGYTNENIILPPLSDDEEQTITTITDYNNNNGNNNNNNNSMINHDDNTAVFNELSDVKSKIVNTEQTIDIEIASNKEIYQLSEQQTINNNSTLDNNNNKTNDQNFDDNDNSDDDARSCSDIGSDFEDQLERNPQMRNENNNNSNNEDDDDDECITIEPSIDAAFSLTNSISCGPEDAMQVIQLSNDGFAQSINPNNNAFVISPKHFTHSREFRPHQPHAKIIKKKTIQTNTPRRTRSLLNTNSQPVPDSYLPPVPNQVTQQRLKQGPHSFPKTYNTSPSIGVSNPRPHNHLDVYNPHVDKYPYSLKHGESVKGPTKLLPILPITGENSTLNTESMKTMNPINPKATNITTSGTNSNSFTVKGGQMKAYSSRNGSDMSHSIPYTSTDSPNQPTTKTTIKRQQVVIPIPPTLGNTSITSPLKRSRLSKSKLDAETKTNFPIDHSLSELDIVPVVPLNDGKGTIVIPPVPQYPQSPSALMNDKRVRQASWSLNLNPDDRIINVQHPSLASTLQNTTSHFSQRSMRHSYEPRSSLSKPGSPKAVESFNHFSVREASSLSPRNQTNIRKQLERNFEYFVKKEGKKLFGNGVIADVLLKEHSFGPEASERYNDVVNKKSNINSVVEDTTFDYTCDSIHTSVGSPRNSISYSPDPVYFEVSNSTKKRIRSARKKKTSPKAAARVKVGTTVFNTGSSKAEDDFKAVLCGIGS